VSPEVAAAVQHGWGVDLASWAAVTGLQVPEVLQPLPSRDGTTLAQAGGHVIEVVPFAAGGHADRADDAQLALVADLLVRLQTACAGLDLGPRPTWGGHPWDPAAWTVHADLPDPELDRWYAEWSASTAAHRAPLHHDVHELNVLVHGGRVTALLDHDDARMAHPDEELAQASWELGSDGWRHDPRRGPTCLDAVERCGRPVDREVLRRLVRVQLRWSVGRWRCGGATDGSDRVLRWAEAFRGLA